MRLVSASIGSCQKCPHGCDTDLIQRVAGRSKAAWQWSLSHNGVSGVLRYSLGSSAACDGGLWLRAAVGRPIFFLLVCFFSPYGQGSM